MHLVNEGNLDSGASRSVKDWHILSANVMYSSHTHSSGFVVVMFTQPVKKNHCQQEPTSFCNIDSSEKASGNVRGIIEK